ncbi:MAG: FtsX-like permease family protein, partial [Chloroflexi bacterium]|nr:FtsX-like permease family protein [Chloroflexota bacterium]
MVRWAVRLFRREWRQQALVLALLGVGVAAAIFGASAAYNVAPVPGNAEFGTANHLLRFDGSDPEVLEADLAAAEEWFGTIDVIGLRQVPVPGLFEPLDVRAQDPQGAYSAPMLDRREGRYPTAAGEVAVTDGVVEKLGLAIGHPFALDGAEQIVVGLVENPSDLNAEFALVAPTAAGRPESVTILVDSNDDRVFAFRTPSLSRRSPRLENEGVIAAAGVLAASAVAMLLVALIAVASFVVVAQRRLRQLGMLAAIGATERNLRLVTVANGALIGAVAAVLGATIALLGWIAAVPQLETAVGHRIDRLDVPWWLIATSMLLAVVAATAAAWWPARAVARIPTVQALSGRPDAPKPAHRSAAPAGILLAIGIVCLAVAGDVADNERVYWTSALLIGTGTLATVLGVLFIGPLAIRALARIAARSPITVRLALRDLARYQARSGAALAAISLALAIPVAIVIVATAAEHTAAEGNLSDRQLLIRAGNVDGPFIPEPAELRGLRGQVERIVEPLVDPAVIPFDVAFDPAVEPDPRFDGRAAITLTVPTEDGRRQDLSLLYIANPEILEPYGLDLGAVDPDTEVLTVETGELSLTGAAGPSESVSNVVTITPGYSSVPGSFITPEALRQRGWEPAPAGRWLVETRSPLTSEEIAAARERAAAATLTIETRDQQEGLLALRTRATAIGMLLALGILAMTVGLIRAETASDLRTLAATGATSTMRRTLTAATAGALALLGSLLG